MREVLIHRPGEHERLVIETQESPEPGSVEELIEVAAARVNFADTLIRMGLYTSPREQAGWPVTPGFEVVGRVAAVGGGITDLASGDEVSAVTLFGRYATDVAVSREQVYGASCERASYDKRRRPPGCPGGRRAVAEPELM